MVGKNNTLVAEQKRSDRHCHYGIRKLSVGVASVLLGVGFFAGNSVAHADTTDTLNDNKGVDTKNSNKIDTSQDVYGTQQNSVSQTENTSTQANVTSFAAVGSTNSSQTPIAEPASQSNVNNSKKESNLETSDASPASVQGLSESKVAVSASQDRNVAEKNNVDRSDQNSAFGDNSTVTGQNQLSASVVNFNVDSRMVNYVDDKAIANNINESKIATDNSSVDHQDGMANKALIGQGVSHTDTLTGVSDQTTDYTTKPTIDNYVNQHYKLVFDDTKGQTLTFDHDGAYVQVYNVHLTHEHSNVSRQSTVNETINYVYQGGVTAANGYKAKPIVFTQTGDKDEVTGEVVWNKVDSQRFASVKSPVIAGFTADITEVPVQTVNFGDKDIIKTVTYEANSQKLVVDFIDDTTGKILQSVVKYGLSNESSDYNTVSDINKYQGMHYDLVSDNTDQKNLFFDHDDNADQHYEVHLKHHIDNVTDNKHVTETIHYRYQDGTSAFDDKVMTIEFTRKGQHDLVTDITTWNNWTPAKGEFDAVESPEIDGYTPDIKVVDGLAVTADSKDIDKVVTYSKNKVIIPDTPEKTPDGPTVKVDTPTNTVVEKTVFKPVAFNVTQKRDADHCLPQTGNKDSTALVTLGFIGLTTGLGFAMKRKHD